VSCSRSRFVQESIRFLVPALAFAFAGFALWLFVDAVTGHGSSGGNILRFGFGLMLLVSSLTVFIIGIIFWRSHDRNHRNVDN
jgi:hypothetical protein